MSAALELQAALVAAIRAAPALAGATVYDGPPPRAPFPYLVLGDALSFDWSTKTERGREHHVALAAWDEAGRTARLQAIVAGIEGAIESLAPALPTNRIVTIVPLRSRVLRPASGPWAGLVEYRVRTRASGQSQQGDGE